MDGERQASSRGAKFRRCCASGVANMLATWRITTKAQTAARFAIGVNISKRPNAQRARHQATLFTKQRTAGPAPRDTASLARRGAFPGTEAGLGRHSPFFHSDRQTSLTKTNWEGTEPWCLRSYHAFLCVAAYTPHHTHLAIAISSLLLCVWQ